MTARFVSGRVPPRIIAPKKTVLARKVGQPLKITFRADPKEAVTWRIAVHCRLAKGMRFNATLKESDGISFDPETATVSGTPTKAFVPTIQVQAAWKVGERASVKTFVLRVTKD